MVGAPIVLPIVTGGLLGLVAGAFWLVVFGSFYRAGTLSVRGAGGHRGGAWCGQGIVSLVPEIAVGLALIGTGLILAVIGVIGTVACVKLCMVVFPSAVPGDREPVSESLFTGRRWAKR